MTRFIDRWLAQLLPLWVGAVQRRPGLVLVAALLLTAVAAAYTATHLEVNTDDQLVRTDGPQPD